MVQALLNTKPNTWPAEPIDPDKPYKSMTRRIVKVKKLPSPNSKKKIKADTPGLWLIPLNGKPTPTYSIAPFQKGDILWVRETWHVTAVSNRIVFFGYKAEGSLIYETTDTAFLTKMAGMARWRPSIFLPREAARIFLEVKGVRIERLQDINPEDAEAEGVKVADYDLGPYAKTEDYYSWAFQCLWNGLNAKRGYSWESNPWVWVYEFMRIK
jgi:hypothetical protein